MSLAEEAVRTPMGAALKGGLDVLDLNQSVTFTLYQQVILPLDGYVFWVKANAVSPSALVNNSPLDSFMPNQPQILGPPNPVKTVMGAVHYASDLHQQEDENYSSNRVVFSAQEPVQDFNLVSPTQLYIGEFDGIRFSFAARGSYFQQSNLHHYVGQAVNSDMLTQIIDDPRLLNTSLIVSNSLPAFLAINRYAPAYPVLIPFPRIPLYPSFLAPLNMRPPFGTVHVEPELTVSRQLAPLFDSTMSSGLLAEDRVRVTLYGCTNEMAQDWLAAFYQYTLDTELVGVVGTLGVVRDDKKFQTEMLVLAERKHIVLDISYTQQAVRNIARQLIEEAFCTVLPQDTVIPIPIP